LNSVSAFWVRRIFAVPPYSGPKAYPHVLSTAVFIAVAIAAEHGVERSVSTPTRSDSDRETQGRELDGDPMIVAATAPFSRRQFEIHEYRSILSFTGLSFTGS